MFQVHFSHPFGRATLAVEGELTIFSATEAHALMKEILAGAELPDIDLSAISELDTAGAQLLVWMKQEAHAANKPLAYVHHSPAVVEALDLLNLTAVLGDPILMAPSGRE